MGKRSTGKGKAKSLWMAIIRDHTAPSGKINFGRIGLKKRKIKKFRKRLKRSAQACPRCRSANITASGYAGDGKVMSCEVECHDCHLHWVEIYTYTSAEDFDDYAKEKPEQQEKPANEQQDIQRMAVSPKTV